MRMPMASAATTSGNAMSTASYWRANVATPQTAPAPTRRTTAARGGFAVRGPASERSEHEQQDREVEHELEEVGEERPFLHEEQRREHEHRRREQAFGPPAEELASEQIR